MAHGALACVCGCRSLTAEAKLCPPEGCSNEPEEVVDVREGILLWSESDTWSDEELFPNGKPRPGDNVSPCTACCPVGKLSLCVLSVLSKHVLGVFAGGEGHLATLLASSRRLPSTFRPTVRAVLCLAWLLLWLSCFT